MALLASSRPTPARTRRGVRLLQRLVRLRVLRRARVQSQQVWDTEKRYTSGPITAATASANPIPAASSRSGRRRRNRTDVPNPNAWPIMNKAGDSHGTRTPRQLRPRGRRLTHEQAKRFCSRECRASVPWAPRTEDLLPQWSVCRTILPFSGERERPRSDRPARPQRRVGRRAIIVRHRFESGRSIEFGMAPQHRRASSPGRISRCASHPSRRDRIPRRQTLRQQCRRWSRRVGP